MMRSSLMLLMYMDVTHKTLKHELNSMFYLPDKLVCKLKYACPQCPQVYRRGAVHEKKSPN